MAAESVVERFLELLRDRTDLTVSERESINRYDRSDLSVRAAHEGFVGQIELGPIYGALLNCQAKIIARKGNDRVPRDALENTLGQIRRYQSVAAHDSNAR